MKRFELIDTLRGLAVINMVGFHACWIMNYFGLFITTEALYGPSFLVWERSTAMAFIIIAGFSFLYGRHHLKAGLKLFGAGLVITAATCLFLPDIRIVFGVLTFLGTAILLMIPTDKLYRKATGGTGEFSRKISALFFVLNVILFTFTYNINKGFIGFGNIFTVPLPGALYRGYAATFIGFMEPGFFSTDYFSFLPWFFLYLSGYFLHRLIENSSIEERFLARGIPGLNTIGRHSLIIYLIHPVALFVLIFLMAKIIRS